MNPFDIARQALSGGVQPGAESSGPPLEEKPEPPPDPDYSDLAERGRQGMVDLDAGCTDEALFLYAFNLVRSCPDPDFHAMGHKYCPFWRRRLDPEAWKIVKGEIKARLKQMEATP